MAQQFPKHLRESVQVYAEKYGYSGSEVERGFEGYLAHLFAQEAGFEEVLDGQPTEDVDLGSMILRRHDLGVDVVLIDDSQQNILLAQAKWLGRGGKPRFEDVDSFFSIHDRVKRPDFLKQGGEAVQALLADYDDKVRDGYSVKLRFATNQRITDDRIDASVKAAQAVFDDRGESVTCEFIDLTELKEIDSQIRTARQGILPSIEFKFQKKQSIEIDDPYHTLVGRISANELRNLYRHHRQQLFALNIRLPMSTQRSINKAIRETADSEPENFFYYNNGVSAVCSDFEVVDNSVSANRFQIINGAQTVGALSFSDLPKDVYVLFRLTATGEKSGGALTENVIRYNNTQNPIRISDFRSNDPIQQFLQKRLPDRSGKGPLPKFYYQAKSGYSPRGRGGRALKSDDLARIRHSFLYGPVPSYKEPKTFWDLGQGGRYREAFGVDGELQDDWSDEVISEALVAFAVHERVRSIATELKTREDPPAEAKYLFRLARYVGALVGAGLRRQFGRVFHSYAELLTTTARFEEVVDPLVEEARRQLRNTWRIRSKKEEVQREYNLARDEEAWGRLRDDFIDELKATQD